MKAPTVERVSTRSAMVMSSVVGKVSAPAEVVAKVRSSEAVVQVTCVRF